MLRTVTVYATGVPISEKLANELRDGGLLRESDGELYFRDAGWSTRDVGRLLQDAFLSAFLPEWEAAVIRGGGHAAELREIARQRFAES